MQEVAQLEFEPKLVRFQSKLCYPTIYCYYCYIIIFNAIISARTCNKLVGLQFDSKLTPLQYLRVIWGKDSLGRTGSLAQ